MKQFDTAHIVQLFGVVSNGQPALMVMEYYWQVKKVFALI